MAGCVANTVIQTGQRQFVLFGSLYLQAFQRCRTGCNQLENRICNTSLNHNLHCYLPVAVPSATTVASAATETMASAETTPPTQGTAEVVAAPAETTRGTATEAIARSGLHGPTLRRRKAP
jgi:hypothetical protein